MLGILARGLMLASSPTLAGLGVSSLSNVAIQNVTYHTAASRIYLQNNTTCCETRLLFNEQWINGSLIFIV